MIKPPVPAFLSVVLALSACSYQSVYDDVQRNRQDECRKLMNLHDREQCMAEADRSYDEYERDRRQVLEDDNSN